MMAQNESSPGWFRGPFWVSGFRPFFLLGSAYGILALGLSLPSLIGIDDFVRLGGSGRLWHGHEMVFGFAAAIVSGLLLTALPSWAGIPEIARSRLALLVCVWFGGRIAVGFAHLLPPALVAIADTAPLVTLIVMLAPGLLAARDRRFLAMLPVLLAMAAANLAFHAQLAGRSPGGASWALDAGVAALAILFSLTGGFLTPVFTRNALVEIGAAARVREHRYIEAAAHASVIAFALACVVSLPARVEGSIAAVACVVHAAMLVGWRGLAARRNAMVLAMHVGYAWLVVAFALAAASALGLGIAPRAWIHAFTIGAVGTMMLALMPRVTLRHTGRPLVLAPIMLVAYPAMSGAALLRLAFTIADWGAWASDWREAAIGGAVALWALCFGVYLALYGPKLVQPSLPRATQPR
jgi:uncharacterized protein involved in response to NO